MRMSLFIAAYLVFTLPLSAQEKQNKQTNADLGTVSVYGTIEEVAPVYDRSFDIPGPEPKLMGWSARLRSFNRQGREVLWELTMPADRDRPYYRCLEGKRALATGARPPVFDMVFPFKNVLLEVSLDMTAAPDTIKRITGSVVEAPLQNTYDFLREIPDTEGR